MPKTFKASTHCLPDDKTKIKSWLCNLQSKGYSHLTIDISSCIKMAKQYKKILQRNELLEASLIRKTIRRTNKEK